MKTLQQSLSPSQLPMQQLLPEFCRAHTVLRVVMLAQALAILMALVPGVDLQFWPRLGLTSLFVHWVALLSIAVLCSMQAHLIHRRPAAIAWFFLLLLLLVTLGVSTAAYSVLQWYNLTQDVNLYAFLLQTMLIALLVGGMGIQLFTLYVQHSWRIGAQSRSELDALQARIRPHFLFNCLNIAAELTHTDANAAETAILDLASLFRAAMYAGTDVSLAEELQLAQQYLALEQCRLAERLQIHWDMPNPLPELQIPCLTLQPLLENAVRHGIERCIEPGEIEVQLTATSRFVTIVLTNPLGPKQPKHSGNGIALANIRRRLELKYGDQAQLTTAMSEQRFRVKLVLPLEQDISR